MHLKKNQRIITNKEKTKTSSVNGYLIYSGFILNLNIGFDRIHNLIK